MREKRRESLGQLAQVPPTHSGLLVIGISTLIVCMEKMKHQFTHCRMTDTRAIADVSRVVSVQESIGTIVNGHSNYTHVVSVENSVVVYRGTSVIRKHLR